MKTKEKYKIIEERFQYHLGYLNSEQRYHIEELKDDFNQPQYKQAIEISLLDIHINRKLRFMYQPFNGREYTTFTIYKIDVFSFIALDSYFKFNKDGVSCPWKSFLSMGDVPGESFEEKVNTYFAFVAKLLKENLRLVIEGKEWIELPTDWEGIGR